MDEPRASNSVNRVGDVTGARLKSVAPGVVCLMIAIALERVTFYVVTTNLQNFFVDVVNVTDPGVAATTYLIFTGTSNFLPLFGGMLGDSLISRYVCTLIGFLIEALGSIVLLALMIITDTSTHLATDKLDYALVFTGLALMAIGIGFHRANILVIGCKGVGQFIEQKKNIKALEAFFRGFYWAVNVGCSIGIIAVTLADTTQKNGRHKPSFSLGIVQTVAILLGAFFFTVGKKWYIRTTPNGSNLRKLRQAFYRKVTSCLRCFRRRQMDSSQRTLHKEADEMMTHVFRMLLVMSSLIMFYIIYSLQLGDIFWAQGIKMDYRIGNTTIPLDFTKGFDSYTIVLVLPFVHFVITPFLIRTNRNISLLKRIGIGLVFGAMSALACGIVETVRQHFYLQCSAHCFSIFWQLPQFVFLSLGEIFAAITSYQFMYSESPPDLEGLVLGIQFCLLGLGSYVASILLLVVVSVKASWYPSDFDKGHAEDLLYFLAGLQVFFFLIFAWYASRYHYEYLYKETEETAERAPLARQTFQTYDSLAPINSNDSLSLAQGEHNVRT